MFDNVNINIYNELVELIENIFGTAPYTSRQIVDITFCLNAYIVCLKKHFNTYNYQEILEAYSEYLSILCTQVKSK